MPNTRIPGPYCQVEKPLTVRDGTMCVTPAAPRSMVEKRMTSSPVNLSLPSKESVMDKAAVFLIEEEACPLHPYWPKGESGVTWGVGWDAGQHSVAALTSDWRELSAYDLEKLKEVMGKKGQDAAKALEKVKDISIPKEVSLKVFKEKTLPTFYQMTMKAFPGCVGLALEVQVALISLIYNRGDKMGDENAIFDRRWEMRRIKKAVALKDIRWIADELRYMKRIWVGTANEKGMNKRRETEAKLVDQAIKQLPPEDMTMADLTRLDWI